MPQKGVIPPQFAKFAKKKGSAAPAKGTTTVPTPVRGATVPTPVRGMPVGLPVPPGMPVGGVPMGGVPMGPARQGSKKPPAKGKKGY